MIPIPLGCRGSPRQTSPMLVNKIDTGVICGTAGKRPLQLIFPPASGQTGTLCGPRIALHRRNGPGFFSFDYVLPGNNMFHKKLCNVHNVLYCTPCTLFTQSILLYTVFFIVHSVYYCTVYFIKHSVFCYTKCTLLYTMYLIVLCVLYCTLCN